MNVSVKHFNVPVDRKALVAEKDVKEGDIIYTVRDNIFGVLFKDLILFY